MLRTTLCDAGQHGGCPGAGRVAGKLQIVDTPQMVEVSVACGCQCHSPNAAAGAAPLQELERRQQQVRDHARFAALEALSRAYGRPGDTSQLERALDIMLEEVWPIITGEADLFATGGSRLAFVLAEVERLAGRDLDRKARRHEP
jgi:hypothetical protein